MEIAVRVCSCSFCIKHGAAWTGSPAGSLRISIKDLSLVSKYAFGTETAYFHVCLKCGVAPVVTSFIDGRLYAVVNANVFEGIDTSLFQRSSSGFADEGAKVRLERRKLNWIANVEYDT